MPVEIPDAIPFETDHEHKSYDAAAANLFWQQLAQVHRVFTIFRARFLGKCSPVHFFWGSFDLAVTRFSGRAAPPITAHCAQSRTLVMQEAYSHEVSSAGFWPGNGGYGKRGVLLLCLSGAGRFCAALIKEASYETALGEFVLPYDAVAQSASPDETLLNFLQATYEAAADRAMWDRSLLERADHACLWRRSWHFVFTYSRAAFAQTAGVWSVPEVGALPRDAAGMQIRKGRDLITATYAHIGPQVADPAKRYAGNNLACTNCHLDAGTKKFGLPLFGLFGAFPQYSARSGEEITVEDRLNSCMTRSMNGRALPNDAPEMQAMVAYIKFLSTGVAPGQTLPGLGSGHMAELQRAADPARGRAIYARSCLACHNSDGSGIPRSSADPGLGYMFPPLGEAMFSMTAPAWRGCRRWRISCISTCRTAPITWMCGSRSRRRGTSRPMCCRSRGRKKPGSRRIFPISCRSRPIRPIRPMPTAFPRRSINTGRLRRSARRSKS